MTLILSAANFGELMYEPAQSSEHHPDGEIFIVSPRIGQGYCREIELLPGLWLEIFNYELHDDIEVRVPVHDHLIQFLILSSGLFTYNNVYPASGGKCSYLSGSGISPAYVQKIQKLQPITAINVHLLPELLKGFMAGEPEQIVKLFIKENEWKVSFFPDVTWTMQAAVRQILNAPFQGTAQRLYLQSKVFELLAMQLEPILADNGQRSQLHPNTIEQLHHAKEILHQRLNYPPSLTELAQLVGLSDRKLQQGFRELFGTTVFGYLHHHRMEQAQIMLRCKETRISEVAHAVGYSHLGHFTAAFKRKFGITPKDCRAGKKQILG
ncbi:helix-turn-helix transcriptional regulator [Gloeocapsopsis crepidinum LEGE 06123]|uniref:Helix-turn-helix transcriptional regulator n=1 Tax=Gloeocapsopsis crepidinum LEGE 06123 TaxID=588587 RepID=A0ABR9UP94_9CHRO|nr:AraC family transcriptional regulator [Gloeocapsopsis crepidinum]MBE9190107.1 helix-turn-helix transcriptional regulator [Gloeocapsopsis crepidinum LEGE 06123]